MSLETIMWAVAAFAAGFAAGVYVHATVPTHKKAWKRFAAAAALCAAASVCVLIYFGIQPDNIDWLIRQVDKLLGG
jgi:peptidoglycan/LPS O-acetylase OafA/YrhL